MSRSRFNLKVRKIIFQSNIPYRIRRFQNKSRYIPQGNSYSRSYSRSYTPRRSKVKTALIVLGLVAATSGIMYVKGYSKALQDSWGTIQEGAKSKAFKTYVHELIDPNKMPKPSSGAVDKAIDSLFGSR